jgi:hypothetical protein
MNALTNRCWQTVSDATEESLSPRALYFQLLADFAARRPTDFTDTKESARFFLKDQLVKAATSTDYFPESLQDLDAWSRESFTDTGLKYREYLKDRRAGTPPRYFSRRSHALDFLRKSAPTKLVDGSWLYGVLTKWNDPRFSGLIRTYLEELGDGIRTQNHVALYRELLAEHGCSDWTATSSRERYSWRSPRCPTSSCRRSSDSTWATNNCRCTCPLLPTSLRSRESIHTTSPCISPSTIPTRATRITRSRACRPWRQRNRPNFLRA